MDQVAFCGYYVAETSSSTATGEKNRIRSPFPIRISSDLNLARSYIAQHRPMMFLDVEWHDRDPPESQRITEIGIVMVNYCGHQTEPLHYIIAEHYYLVQNYVTKDNRKFDFAHGTSQKKSLLSAKRFLETHLRPGRVIVGHDVSQDLVKLNLGVDYKDITIFDTQSMMGRHFGIQHCSLKKAAAHFGFNVSESEWHNAGNDAYWTMKIFRAMANA